MVPSKPINENEDRIEFLTSDEDYAQFVEQQRHYARELALKVERAEPLGRMDKKVISSVLTHWAKNLSSRQPRRAGQAPRLDPGELALAYALKVNGHGRTKTRAISELAEEHGVSIEAVKKQLKKFGDAALNMIPKNPNLIKK